MKLPTAKSFVLANRLLGSRCRMALFAASALRLVACDDEPTATIAGDAAGETGSLDDSGGSGSESGSGDETGVADESDSSTDGGVAPVEEEEPEFDCTIDENTCQEPIELEVVDGDLDSVGTAHSIKGYLPGWYAVTVRETNQAKAGICGGVFGFVCRAKPGCNVQLDLSLASPEGVNYDFEYFRYKPSETPGEACLSGPVGGSEEVGENTDSSLVTWGEGCSDNLSDDTEVVLIHIRHIEGACAPSREWTLTFQGSAEACNKFYDCGRE